jgi:hypothetical protein
MCLTKYDAMKTTLCLIKQHSTKMYKWVKVEIHAFLASALDGVEWLASRPCRFTPEKEPQVSTG